MENKPKLYALLVGIDTYSYPVRSLKGCVNDFKRIKAYLESQHDYFDLHLEELTNLDATKKNIVAHFGSAHLGKAKAGDTVFFYFAGHGTQEYANKRLWTEELDGRLECLVCNNAERDEPFLLADKELRYLIAQLSNVENAPEIITIFDCCHSGDNTREGLMHENSESAEARQHSRAFPERNWTEFIFHNQIDKSEVAQNFPFGTHIQMAACQDEQVSQEDYLDEDVDGRQGIFTYHLLKILNLTQGNVSYYELRNRIKNYTKFKYKQTPQLFYSGTDNSALMKGFLGRPIEAQKPFQGGISKDMQGNWLLNLGALQGISPNLKTLEILTETDETLHIPVKKLEPDVTILDISDEMARYFPKEFNPCFVRNFLSEPLTIFIQDDEGEEGRADYIRRLIEAKVLNIRVTDTPSEAYYLLQIISGEYRFFKEEDPLRPILRMIEFDDLPEHTAEILDNEIREADGIMLAYLQQMAQWTYIKELQNKNPDQTVFRDKLPLALTIKRKNAEGQMEVVTPVKDVFSVEYFEHTSEGYYGEFEIEVENVYHRDVYCALVFLQATFTAMTRFDDNTPDVYHLQPGQKVTLLEASLLDKAYVRDYNWKGSTTNLKLLVSTDDNLEMASFNLLDALPMPEDLESNRDTPNLREIGPRRESRSNKAKGWITQDYVLFNPNPEYNKITAKKLQELLEHEVLGEYALGIYMQKQGFEQALELKEEIELIEEEDRGVKDFVWDLKLNIANSVARSFRMKRFRRNMRKYPNRVLMVSEGDSWFQHPLVKETIDQLSKYYNIYSVGAAGDQLLNIFAEGEILKALEDVKGNYEKNAKFLLLSGGGNDILGKQFRDYLANETPETPVCEDPSNYFDNTFFEKIDAIMNVYKAVFELILNKFPALDIITHGYDFIPPQYDKKGWVNKYMDEKGITTEEERACMIKFMIDLFNTRLQEVAANYDRVFHIDARNAVKSYQWYDEIHPNRDGFMAVVVKYIDLIERRLRERGLV